MVTTKCSIFHRPFWQPNLAQVYSCQTHILCGPVYCIAGQVHPVEPSAAGGQGREPADERDEAAPRRDEQEEDARQVAAPLLHQGSPNNGFNRTTENDPNSSTHGRPLKRTESS